MALRAMPISKAIRLVLISISPSYFFYQITTHPLNSKRSFGTCFERPEHKREFFVRFAINLEKSGARQIRRQSGELHTQKQAGQSQQRKSQCVVVFYEEVILVATGTIELNK